MYRKRDKNQLTMEEFYLPFGNGLKTDNRWAKTAKMISRDVIEGIYAEELSAETGRPSIPSRIAFGALGRARTKRKKTNSKPMEDSVKRSEVESKNGIVKRRYGLDLIMANSNEGGLADFVSYRGNV